MRGNKLRMRLTFFCSKLGENKFLKINKKSSLFISSHLFLSSLI